MHTIIELTIITSPLWILGGFVWACMRDEAA